MGEAAESEGGAFDALIMEFLFSASAVLTRAFAGRVPCFRSVVLLLVGDTHQPVRRM